MSEYLTSPPGKILYMNLDKPRFNKYSGREECSARYLFDGNTAEGAAFREAVSAVSPAKVVTESKTVDIPEGHYIVGAWSNYAPKVTDADGEEVTEVPYFTAGSTGTAIMTLKSFTADKGSGFNLAGVAILDLDLKPQEKTENAAVASLREALKKVRES